MSVTPARWLAGVLPVVISGGRPALADRPTRRLLAALEGVTADPVWLVRDDRAAGYERDRWEVVGYPLAEAEPYAAAHWIGPDPFAPGAFLGCFTEREWACRTAEARGCWAVLQLDDNIRQVKLFTGYGAGRRAADAAGGLGLFADLLAAVTLATNSVMTGAKLDAVTPQGEVGRVARAGFPYSLFLEVVGAGRLPYYGPIEEDILHAYQYGADPTAATAALVLPLHYLKDHHRQGGGMRPFYRDERRSVGLQRVAPEMARLSVHRGHANGRGTARVFHSMRTGAIRTPLVVTDAGLYAAVGERLRELSAGVAAAVQADAAERVAARAARWE
jgi:hypothetical protein